MLWVEIMNRVFLGRHRFSGFWPLGLIWLAAVLGSVACDPGSSPSPSASVALEDSLLDSLSSSGVNPPRAVVVISLDTLRADHLGVYGHDRFTSPMLDQFAREGVVFEDASAPSPWTLPSHASLLTGLSPARHGLDSSEERLSEEVRTLAGFFAEEGWQTAAIVNTLYLKREQYGITRDFEDYFEVDRHPASIQPSMRITEEAKRLLLGQGERPLFLFVHYFDIHADYASMPTYEDLMVTPYEGLADGSSWQLRRANFSDRHIEGCIENFRPLACDYGNNSGTLRIDSDMERISYGPADIRHLKELYDAGIRQTDTEVGKILNYIEEIGRSADTIVLVTSDHGEEFQEHGRVGHFLTMYQESLRVPLLLRGPGIPEGVRFDVPVSLIDIPATLLALSGVAVPKELEGLDLSQLWRGETDMDWNARILFGEASGGLEYHRWFPGVYPIYRSVRRGSMKLVERVWDGEITYALYDLRADPQEARDLAEERSGTVGEFRSLLDTLDQRTPLGSGNSKVDLSPEESEQLRALGYVP
jgi:arylsulfatase A-like enzyme